MINPGNTASATSGTTACNAGSTGTEPDPALSQITITSSTVTSNPPPVTVFILGYACVYDGGYIFSFDDTTDEAQSVAGKVITMDTPSGSPSVWANVTGLIYGTAADSTTTDPSPSNTPLEGQVACNGSTDGACNSNNINISLTAASQTNYAVNVCNQTIEGYTDWYLPAVCELGYGLIAAETCGDASTPVTQNVATMVAGKSFSFPVPPDVTFWSSTTFGSTNAVSYNFTTSLFPHTVRTQSYPIVCARSFGN